MTDAKERRARAALFANIEENILPEAEARIDGIEIFSVEGVSFGSRPPQAAFGKDGELRFEPGRWNGSAFEPFREKVLFPVRPPPFDVAYPVEVAFVPTLRAVFAHYTPVTRRLDYYEVWDYFNLMKSKETDVRHKAFGLLESRIAGKYSGLKVKTSVRYVRYSEYYAVVTEVESRDFARAGEAEAAAVRGGETAELQ